MPLSAKLRGLGALVSRLQAEDASRWRLVVFTGRVETQTTIQNFLEEKGLSVGVINGTTAARNQHTLAGFRAIPPRLRVIVSTEAGSEGLNLQVANVLVNYDLPWNPMIVEQRIGRVQRLASEHRSVAIFNVMLRGTFEEYIVGRLMEKLQLASHAVGDIESLLEASGVDADGEEGFEELLRQLVVAALAGKDTEEAVRLQERSIAEAKVALEREEESMNALLGGDDPLHRGPRTPDLPAISRSMLPREFVLASFEALGAEVRARTVDTYLVEEAGSRELICFNESSDLPREATNYQEDTAAFRKLVGRMVNLVVHNVTDMDEDPLAKASQLAREWAGCFAASISEVKPLRSVRCFNGSALLRVRAVVAHDSYERLVTVPCVGDQHRQGVRGSGRGPLVGTLEDPQDVGIVPEYLIQAAQLDPAIAEFCRFYSERREEEVRSAGDDARRRKKLEDDFTPRLEFALVGLEGKVHQQVAVRVDYRVDEHSVQYSDVITAIPHLGTNDEPAMGRCMLTNKDVPRSCLEKCAVSDVEALRHLLVRSEISSRSALPVHTVRCVATGKLALIDEVQKSDVTGKSVVPGILKTSALSGIRAEPEFFGRCEFTQAEVLREELLTSEVSGKRYRKDEQSACSATGKRGHPREFLICHESNSPILPTEAERCSVTRHYVRRGLLQGCSVSNQRVLPRELDRCPVSRRHALKKYFVASSLSGTKAIESEMVSSSAGSFCLPDEAKECVWSSRLCHPEDVRTCNLTGLRVHFRYIGERGTLHALFGLLDGTDHSLDADEESESIVRLIAADGGKCRIESATYSPERTRLAVCCEVRRLLGFRVSIVGLVFDLKRRQIVGRKCVGHRSKGRWVSNSV